MSEYLLEMSGICKSFAGVHALDHVDFKVRPGKVMCLAGENGCGKSTLVKIISGVYTRDEGTVTFEGKDKSVMSRRTEYGSKCLLLSLDEIAEYFNALNVTKVDVNGTKRREINLFDYPSFREAWINACLHNDWNNAIAPSVYMFDDRIEIVSYGGLPYTLTREGFFNGTSVPVNKSLLLVFIAAGYAEQSGHGVPTIVSKYGREIFSFEDGMVKVSIPLEFDRGDVVERKNIIKQKRGLTKNQKAVYEILTEDGKKSLQEVADEAGLSLAGVKKICLKLQEYGVLERVGSKKDGFWVTK